MNPLVVARTMAKRGFLAPAPPHRLVRQMLTTRAWGYGIAGELRQAVARSPEAVAVVDDDRRITYADLLAQSNAVGAHLAARGLGPGSRVGLLARNHAGGLAVILGASALGADLVLVNTGLGSDALATVAREQGLQLLVHDDEFAELVRDLATREHPVELLSETVLAQALGNAAAAEDPGPPDRPGRTIVLTSGTTGLPRAAARPTPGGLGPMISMLDRIPLNNTDRVLLSAPLFHSWGFAALQLSLGVRATMVLQRRFDPSAAHAALVEHRCQVMFAVPVLIERMLATARAADLARPPELRVVAVSGSALSAGFAPAFMDRYGEVLHSLYGSTEASWICIADPRQLRPHPDTAGTPPLGTRVELLDEQLRPVSDGESGQFYVGSDMVARTDDDGAPGSQASGLVATGDLGHRSGGLFYVDGRADDMVVSGGENVHPSAVQRVIEEHPAVREACVAGVPDHEFGQRLAAFVCFEPGERVPDEQLRALVRDRVARHAAPRDLYVLDELPRNATGKVVVRELLARYT